MKLSFRPERSGETCCFSFSSPTESSSCLPRLAVGAQRLTFDCVTQRLWRGVEGPRRCLSSPCCSELFNHRARTGRPRHGLSLEPRTKNLLASCYVRRLHLHSRQPYRYALHRRHEQAVSPCSAT